MNRLTYKGFTAKIEFDERDDIFVGRVLGIPEIVVFHGETVQELKSEMAGMIDFHIEVCERTGKKPKKKYSGKLLLRMPEDLHAKVAEAAAVEGASINEWTNKTLERVVNGK